jgi:hypothetical protein
MLECVGQGVTRQPPDRPSDVDPLAGIVNGTYPVTIQVRVTTAGDQLRIDDWHPTLESVCYGGSC